MAWFGESLTNITGQISNFTKEVLTEGTEEVDDHVTELRVAKNKIRELEVQCSSQLVELDRLKFANRELQENADSAELQINAISSEYRDLLAKKENEVKELKQKQHELQQRVVSSVITPGSPSSPTLSHSTSTTQLSSPMIDRSGFHSDDADFSDVIASQREINRLNQEVQRLHAETLHWRQLVQSRESDVQSQSSENDVSALKTQIKELNAKLHQEVDESQRELAALQDIHSQKLLTLKRAHKQQVADLEDTITELEEQLESVHTSHTQPARQSSSEQPSTTDDTDFSLVSQIDKLEHDVREKTRELTILGHQLETLQAEKMKLCEDNEKLNKSQNDLTSHVKSLEKAVEQSNADRDGALARLKEQQKQVEVLQKSQGHDAAYLQDQLASAKTRIEELERSEAKVRSDLFTTKKRLLAQLDTNHAQTTEMLRDLQSARRNFDRDSHARKSNMIQEKHQLVNKIIEAGQQKSELKSTVQSLEAEGQSITQETTDIVAEIGNEQHQQLTASIVDSLEEENKVLQQHSHELQQTVDNLQKCVMELSAEKLQMETSLNEMSIEIHQLRGLKRSDSEKTLEHLGDSETESNLGNPMDKFVASTPLQRPKANSNASDTPARYQSLPFDAQSFDELETDSVISGFSEISSRNRALDDQVHTLQSQIEHYENEIEQFELVKSDWQMEKESLEEVLFKLREDLREKEMQMSVAQAEQGLNKAKKKRKEKTDMEKGLIAVEKHDRDVETETADSESESESDIESGIHDLVRKVELLTLANAQLERERDTLARSKNGVENELAAVQKQYEEVHQSVLQKNNTSQADVSLKLEEKDKELSELSMERDTLLTSLEELDSQHQEAISQLIITRDKLSQEKKEVSLQLEDMRRQLDTSVDEARNLNGERESLLQQISQLKVKLESGAMAVNDLHMDKKELEVAIDKMKRQLEEARKSETKARQERKELETNCEQLSQTLDEAKSELILVRESSTNQDVQRELETKIQQLEHQMAAQNESNEGHKQRNADLQTSVVRFEALVAQMNEDKSKLSVQLEKSEKQLTSESEQLNAKYQKYAEECEMQIDALKSEKHSLEKEMNQAQLKHSEQTKQLESYINELTRAREMDTSSLQVEHEKLMKLVHSKDVEITSLKTEFDDLKTELEDNKEMLQSTIDGQKPLTDLINERENELSTLKLEHSKTAVENYKLSQNLEQLEGELLRYQDIENQLKSVREENRKLFSEVESLRAKQDSENIDTRTLDVITDLEAELNTLKLTLAEKDDEICSLNQTIKDHETGITYLNEKKTEHLLKLNQSEGNLERYGITIAVLEQKLKLSEQENSELKEQLEGDNDSAEVVRKLQRLTSIENSNVTSDGVKIAGMLEWKDETPTVEGGGHIDSETGGHVESSDHIDNKVQSRDETDAKVLDLESSLLQKVEDMSAMEYKMTEVKTACEQEVKKLKKHCDTLKEEITARDHDIELLSEKLDTSQIHLEDKTNQLEDCLDKLEKAVSSPRHELVGSESRLSAGDGSDPGESYAERDSVSDEIKEMRKIIRDKDEIISELRDNSSSLLKMLDNKSLSVYGDKTLSELHQLQISDKKLKMEKEQIIAVLNEKSRENSSLKNEVHRLMNAVSSEKVALNKLQQDSNLMNIKTDVDQHSDMTKEAVHNLSCIIRDKDLEIESLQQKNQTLLAVLQETAPSSGSNVHPEQVNSAQISSLLQERDNLSKQLGAYQNEREQMIALVNQKHQEAVTYHGEVQRLGAFIQEESKQLETLQQQYAQLSQQFENNKQSLINAQNDLLNAKQKCSDAEAQVFEMSAQENDDSVPKSLFDSKCKEVEEVKEKVTKQKQALLEKDNIVGEMLQQNNQKDSSLQSKESENSALRKQVESLTFQVQGLETEVNDLTAEKETLTHKSSEHDSEAAMLKEINSKVTLSLREKEFEMNALKEKVKTLSNLLEERGSGEQTELHRLMKESESMQGQAQRFQQERDQVLLALQQRQMETGQLLQQLEASKSQEEKLTKELDRLRGHLIQIEEGYTRDALESEEREKDLRNRLAIAEEKAQSSSSAVESVNLQASQQLDSLQVQLQTLASQRDQAIMQLQASQEQTQQYAHSLANLQMVLEQFQLEKEAEKMAEIERFQRELDSSREECLSLKAEVAELKNEVIQQSDALEAAHRLSQQLDRKEEAMAALKQEVESRENQLKEAEDRIHHLTTSTETKVDKTVIKNLFMGYFSAPQGKRQEVLRLVGSVLDFNHDELIRIGAEKGGGSWMPSLWGKKPTPTPPATPSKSNPNQSFSELFVNFLERESTPQRHLKLPVDAMVKEEQQKQHQRPAFNPFSAAKHATHPIKIGELQTQSESHLLMSALPSFTPVLSEAGQNSATSSGRSTPSSGAILKHALNQQS